MKTIQLTKSRTSKNGAINGISPTPNDRDFDPDEIRRLVRIGTERGLIRPAGVASPIDKNGEHATNLGGVRSQWIDVTPKSAKFWLDNNFRNRRVSDDVVRAYARDMLIGDWIPTHQGIAFNDRDELIDGQHRLLAIIMSGVTIRMMVTFGLPSKIDGKEMTTMDAVDRGRMRSVADQLKIQHGFKDGWVISAISAAIANTCCGERTRRLSVGQTLQIFRAYEDAVRWVITHRSKEHGLRTIGTLSAFAFALSTEGDFVSGGTFRAGHDTGSIARMFEALNCGVELKKNSAIAHLRTFLVSDDAKLLSRAADRGLAELVMQAIYLEIKGKPIAKLELALDGVNHFRTLQKERVDKIAALFTLPKVGK